MKYYHLQYRSNIKFCNRYIKVEDCENLKDVLSSIVSNGPIALCRRIKPSQFWEHINNVLHNPEARKESTYRHIYDW